MVLGFRAWPFAFGAAHVLMAMVMGSSAQAQSASPQTALSHVDSFPFALDGAYHEIETKYIFGFVDGSDIGAEGEKSIAFETTTAFKKRGGRFGAVDQEVEFEHVPSQFFAYELSAHGLAHTIHNVSGLEDRNQQAFGGLSSKASYLLVGRGPGSPIGVRLMAAPEWSRIDGTSGAPVRGTATTFKIAADTELVPNRFFAALNASYAPEWLKTSGSPSWERASSLGVSGALAYRVHPKVTIGAALDFERAYKGLGINTLQGHALYVGPTLHVQLTSKIMLAAAFAGQVSGRAVGESSKLDLTNFEKYHGNLKLEFEF